MRAGIIAVQDSEHNCICMTEYELAGRNIEMQLMICYLSRVHDEKKKMKKKDLMLTFLDVEESARVPLVYPVVAIRCVVLEHSHACSL